MASKPQKLFLERQTYRRRRLGDLIKLLPVFGTLLFVIPVLWGSEDSPAKTSSVGLYLFAVWGGLVVALLVLSSLRRSSDAQSGPHPMPPVPAEDEQAASLAKGNAQ